MALPRSRVRAARILPVAVTPALVAAALTVATPHAAASAADDRGDCDTSSDVARYVVLFDESTSAEKARSEIEEACGEQTIYYEQIGVAVVTSEDTAFAEHIGTDRAFSAQLQRRDAYPAALRSPRPAVELTDPDEVDDTDLSGQQWNLDMINAGGRRSVSDEVVVGVLDSGIDPEHPDLADAVDPDLSVGCLTGKPKQARKAWEPTTSAHGTHVAGTIAAADDGSGITGVAPGARLASIKVTGDRGYVDPEAAICGLMWAAEHEMTVTNSSFFVDPWSQSCTQGDGIEVMREALSRAAEHATDSGTLNVAAATNEAVNLSRGSSDGSSGCEALPASLRSVVAVSSVGTDGMKSQNSSYGLGVITVAAPGGDGDQCVPTTVPGGYDNVCGTSMAAPHAAGVIALLAADSAGEAGPDELRRALTSSAQPTTCPTDYDRSGDGHQDAYCTGYRAYNSFYGHGLVDAAALAPGAGTQEAAAAPDVPDSESSAANEDSGDTSEDDEDPVPVEKPSKPITETVEEITGHLGSVLHR